MAENYKDGMEQINYEIVGLGNMPSFTCVSDGTGTRVHNDPVIFDDSTNRHCTAWEQIKPAINLICDCLDEIKEKWNAASASSGTSGGTGDGDNEGGGGGSSIHLEALEYETAPIRALAEASIMRLNTGE